MHYQIYLSRLKVWSIIIGGVLGLLPAAPAQVANNDFYTVAAASVLTVAAPGVLANDTGVGGFSAVLVSGPADGALTLNSSGSFTYTPTAGFTGTDSFTYQARHGGQASGVATVSITVTGGAPPGELFYDNFTRPAGSTSISPWTVASGAQLAGSWGITNNLLIGKGPNTNYSYAYYTNNWVNYSVQAQIRFSADNAASAGLIGRLVTASGAHYSLWVYPENSPESFASGNGTPMMYMFKYQNWTWPYTQMGSPVTLPGVGVGWHTVKLAFQGNTISAYFDGSRVMSVTDDGTIDGNAPYAQGGIGMTLWTLPPAAYTLSVDNIVVSSSTNCMANGDVFIAPTNATLRVTAPGVLANDTGGGPLTALLVSGPAQGDFTLTNNGGFSYTPTNGFSGTDSFSYACTDGQTTSAVTTVILTVTNSVLASDDTFITASNTTLRMAQPGVLSNDLGGAGPLTVLLAGGPTDGTLTLTNNGGFSYTPATGFIGTDSFTYRCTDGQSTSAVAVVTLAVIPPLAAKNDFYSTGQGAVLTVPAPGVLFNDISTNSALTAILAGGPAHGNLDWGGDGSFIYTPATNFTGMDAFTYRANNGAMTSGVATAGIMITPPGGLFYDNFARPAGSGSLLPWVRQSGAWSLTNNILAGTSAFNSYGYLYYNNAGWTDYVVQAQLRFSSTNAWGGALGGRLNPNNGAHYAVWIYPEGSPWGPQNGFPAGVATLQIIKYETWLAYTTQALVRLTGVGTNWHNVKLAFQGSNIFAYFDNNLVTNLTDTGSFDSQPAFTNGGISLDLWTVSPAAFTLSVSNVTVAPLVLNDSYSVNENTTLTVTKPGVLSNDMDIYGTNLTATLVSGPTNGILNLSTNGGFTYTPATNFSGTDGFTVQASDKQNQLGTAQVTITVIPAATLTVTADNQARVYGTTNPTWTVSYTGFINGDGTNVLTGAPALSAGADATSPVGNYIITVSQGTLGSTNYSFHFVNGTLTVNPAALTVTAGNTNKLYGQTVTFAGTEFTRSGLVNGDTVSLVTLNSGGAAATAGAAGSPYVINATNATGSGLTNYVITYQSGMLTVNPAALTVTADDKTRMYGLTNPVLTASYNGFVNSEGANVLPGSPALATPADPGSPVGGYPITVTPGTLSSANYNFTFHSGTLTVTSAPAPVILSYGLTNQVFTVTWSSVAGETYELQSATNLINAGWSSVVPEVTATGPTTSGTNVTGNVPQQFYRVSLLGL